MRGRPATRAPCRAGQGTPVPRWGGRREGAGARRPRPGPGEGQDGHTGRRPALASASPRPPPGHRGSERCSARPCPTRPPPPVRAPRRHLLARTKQRSQLKSTRTGFRYAEKWAMAAGPTQERPGLRPWPGHQPWHRPGSLRRGTERGRAPAAARGAGRPPGPPPVRLRPAPPPPRGTAATAGTAPSRTLKPPAPPPKRPRAPAQCPHTRQCCLPHNHRRRRLRRSPAATSAGPSCHTPSNHHFQPSLCCPPSNTQCQPSPVRHPPVTGTGAPSP